jgi:hypothetical protein
MARRWCRAALLGVAVAVWVAQGVAAAPPPSSSWTQVSPTTISERRGAAEAYDAATGQLVLFGGDNTVNCLADTWVYRNGMWQRLAASGPAPRTDAAMAYDPVTRTVILFGGDPHAVSNGTSYLGDTWSFDGTAWTQLHPLHAPSTRAEAAMAWDDADRELVLFGGLTDDTGIGQDTWTFDGVDWTHAQPQQSPPMRHGAAMAWDAKAGAVVMFGGLGLPPAGSTSPYLADTWMWHGGQWNQWTASGVAAALPSPPVPVPMLASTPQGRWAAAMAPAADGSVVMFGGYWDSGAGAGVGGLHTQGPSSTLSDTWTFDGGSWRQLSAAGPPGRYQAAIAWDSAAHADLLYGGCCNSSGGFLTDTWTFDGGAWAEHERGDAPSVRSGAAVVSDTDDGSVVLFGGFGGGGFLGDTWIERRGVWRSIAPSATGGPVGRFAASFAYDSVHGQAVLFGGQAASGNECTNTVDQLNPNHLCSDTWTFDGSTWSRSAVATANPPPRRSLAAMAYDPATGQTVLYGGFADLMTLGDTWVFDGTSWTQQSPSASPPPVYGATLTYDPTLHSLVLFGGEGDDSSGNLVIYDQTWAWTGATWQQLTPLSSPPGLYEAGATWDPDLGGLMVVAGQGINGPGVFGTYGDAWLFDGTTWTLQTVSATPGPRYFASLGWDGSAHAAMLFGGVGNDGWTDDTWMLGAAHTHHHGPPIGHTAQASLYYPDRRW